MLDAVQKSGGRLPKSIIFPLIQNTHIAHIYSHRCTHIIYVWCVIHTYTCSSTHTTIDIPKLYCARCYFYFYFILPQSRGSNFSNVIQCQSVCSKLVKNIQKIGLQTLKFVLKVKVKKKKNQNPRRRYMGVACRFITRVIRHFPRSSPNLLRVSICIQIYRKPLHLSTVNFGFTLELYFHSSIFRCILFRLIFHSQTYESKAMSDLNNNRGSY